jgi:hypothetical protein
MSALDESIGGNFISEEEMPDFDLRDWMCLNKGKND